MARSSSDRAFVACLSRKSTTLLLPFLAGSLAFGFPAIAQSGGRQALPPDTKGQPAFCTVQRAADGPSLAGEEKPLVAICGRHGLFLGAADDYKVIANESSQAVLVDIQSQNTRRILLISRQDEGPPLLEDLSGQISLSAGKGPMSPLEEIDVDLASFAADGTILTKSRPVGGEAGRSTRIDLKQQVDGVRAARAAVSAKN